jgi:hypothetical protein
MKAKVEARVEQGCDIKPGLGLWWRIGLNRDVKLSQG